MQGGWVSPDEATSTHSAVADQLIQGHLWLDRTFGVTPTIGFQIDPFGASTTVAQLWKSAGFTHHVIDRINYRTKDLLKEKKALQFLWYPSADDTTAPGAPSVTPTFRSAFSNAAQTASDAASFLKTATSTHFTSTLSLNHGLKSRSYDEMSAEKSEQTMDLQHERTLEFSSKSASTASNTKNQVILSRPNTKAKSAQVDSNTPYIFTHILDENYCFPMLDGFDFEGDETKNPKITNANMLERADAYARQIRKRSKEFRIPRLLMLHNCDFRYQKAYLQFDNMDKIINFINGHQERYNVSIKWSSLSDYFSTVDSTYPPSHWPVRGQEDFLPYDDNDESWWVGFYSSRPELKGTIRKAEAELRILDNLFTYTSLVGSSSAVSRNPKSATSKPSVRPIFFNSTANAHLVDELHRAVGIAQHHDAVSGTERQLVAENYAQLLKTAQSASDPIVESFINYIASEPSTFNMEPMPRTFSTQASRAHAKDSHIDQHNQGTKHSSFGKNRPDSKVLEAANGPSFSRLPKDLQNLVVDVPVTVLVYNSLRKSRYEIVKVPVWNDDIVVQDRKGKTLQSSIFSNLLLEDTYHSPYTLFIEAQHIPPAGFITLTLRRTGVPVPAPSSLGAPDFPTTIMNDKDGLSVKVDWNGKITSVTVEGSPIPFLQDLKSYHAYSGPGQASGAYIFRPNGTKAHSITDYATTTVRSTSLVSEIFQSFAPYVNISSRIYANPQLYMDVTYRIGPLPGNRELVSRFETAIATSKGDIATDNNGWAVMNRKERKTASRDGEEGLGTDSIAANYYPAVYSSFIHPPRGGAFFAIVTDRTHGVSSVDQGALEMMLHRRLLQDDDRGLDQALNDTSIVTLHQRFVFASDIVTGTTLRYHYALETNYPLALFYSPIGGTSYTSQFTSAFNASYELPKGIQSFVRAMDSNSGKILVRYAYQYAYADGYGPVSLDLSLALGPLASAKICGIQETHLSGTTTAGPPLPARSSITIYPKEFRTFVYTPCTRN